VVGECCRLSVWLALTVGAAQTAPQTARAAEPIPVEVRAEQYWKARAERDLIAAHPFYCTAYKARVPLNEFVKMTRLTRFELKDVKVAKTTPVGERVEVTVKFQFMAPKISAEPLDGQAMDVWAKDTDGQWCKEDEPFVLPFQKTPNPEPKGPKQ
jgi:hypothetical protein